MERFVCEIGQIVLSKAGRDAGRYFLVTGMDGAELLLADGRHRMLNRPKRKNPAHVQATAKRLDPLPETDRALRNALHALNEAEKKPLSKPNQIRKEVIEDVEAGCD